MNSAEYANMDAVERDHWYYAGKRKIVRGWLQRCGPPQAGQVLLDCGAGTGRFALEMEALCRVLVLDDHEEALRLLRARFRPEQILSLAGDQVPLPDGALDYVTALDVLEHVPDDAAVVRGFHRLLKPGGLAVVTVPAGMALWGDWDEALHHYRRYARPQLRALFPDEQWEILYLNYTNVVVYPAVWVVRKWRRLTVRRGVPTDGGEARTEDRLPPAWLNRMLQGVFVGLATVRVPFPFGVSLLLVARRRATKEQGPGNK
ncbi:MAG TPA: class I SAM-dependent methyltransferase [Lacunisphaera sp.]|nr:class I SAM-dependent methyltransferase [Lacunisphaera sp.]